MTQIMKQRLIGSLLLLVAISLLAVVLMNKASQSELKPETLATTDDFHSSIEVIAEQAVAFEQEALVDPHNLTSVEIENKAVEEVKVEDTLPAPAPAPAPAPQQTAENIINNIKDTTTWIIQLASFTVFDNAQSLQQKVEKLGYTAKIESSQNNNKTLFRVRIGPEIGKKNAEKIADEISAKLNIKPQLLVQ